MGDDPPCPREPRLSFRGLRWPATGDNYPACVEVGEFQQLMERTYGDRDRNRGLPASVAWLAEEIGELARAARKGSPEQQLEELADVLAWTASIANQLGLSLTDAVQRYAGGCPKCGAIPCTCG